MLAVLPFKTDHSKTNTDTCNYLTQTEEGYKQDRLIHNMPFCIIIKKNINNKMKNNAKIPHLIVGTVPKSNRKIGKTDTNYILLTHIYMAIKCLG